MPMRERFKAGYEECWNDDTPMPVAETLGVIGSVILKPVFYGVLLAGPGVPVLPWSDKKLFGALAIIVVVGIVTDRRLGELRVLPLPKSLSSSAFQFGLVCGALGPWVFAGKPTCAFLVGLVVLGLVNGITSAKDGFVGFGIAVAGLVVIFLASLLGPVDATLITARPQSAGNAFNDVLRVFLLLEVLLVLRAVRDDVDRAREKAARLEAERDDALRRAVEAERADIARELHDVVAHHVSLMVVQAEGAASVLPRDPTRAATAVSQVAVVGRQAMAELRRLLGVLRPAHDGVSGELAPQPALADLDALTRQMRDAGIDVTLTVDGVVDSLPIGLELSVYRIVQEALTNTLKHAGPTAARVAITRTPSALEVEVVDDGPAGAARAAVGDGSQQGIVGMRERVALFGGALDVGAAGRGFRVHATFPLVEQPA